MKQREQYFDIAKGIGIILVVIGHIEYVPLEIRQYIVTFHMPLFFVIGGMLMYLTGEAGKPLKELLPKKLKRIMLPYLIFSIIFPMIGVAYYIVTGSQVADSFATYLPNLLVGLSCTGISVLWFLPALFFGELIVLVLVKFSKKILWEIISIAVLVGIWTIGYFNNAMSLVIWRALYCSLFVLAGFLICPLINRLKTMPVILLICATVYYIVLYFTGLVNGIVDLHYIILGNKVLYFFNAMLGSVATIFLAVFLEYINFKPVNNLFSFYGKNSLIVMITHIDFFILYFSETIALKLLDYIPFLQEFIFNLIILILVFSAEAVIICLWTKIKSFIPVFCPKH